MEDWKERYDKFEKRFWLKMKGRVYYDNYETVTIKEGWNIEVKRFIEQELSKAREEGYGEGVKDGMKGKVFSKVEIKEEAHIPKELIEKIREEGRREVYEAIVFDKNIPHDVTTFVAANLWKNMRDKAKEELSKLTTK